MPEQQSTENFWQAIIKRFPTKSGKWDRPAAKGSHFGELIASRWCGYAVVTITK